MEQKITSRVLSAFIIIVLSTVTAHSQDDLEALLDDVAPVAVQPVKATFKSGRVINLHTNERVAAGNLELRISHRFGRLNGGAYELWGLDQSTIRIGLDYGITNRLNVGFGRSSYKKYYDGFIKYAFLEQNTDNSHPISLVGVSSIAISTLQFADPTRDNLFSSRITYVNQLVIARKFSDRLSLELVPGWVHYNLVTTPEDQNDIPVISAGGRLKVSKRVSINAEYNFRIQTQSTAANLNDFTDSFSIGVDIETGGHVFQFQLTNSLPMLETGFLTETTDQWLKGGIHLGFNITREFVLKH
tara:strand:+ start:422 stop:1324 length:903 start_codon:yes stop_codon:yes gene_type:complete